MLKQIDEIYAVIDLGESEEYFYDVGMYDTPHTFFADNILVHNSLFLDYGKIFNGTNFDYSSKEKAIEACLKIDAEAKIYINEACSDICNNIMNCTNNFNFETEEQIERLLITSKKKYIARINYDKVNKQFIEDYIVKGMDFKKSNLSEPIKKILKKMTISIMDGATEEDVTLQLREAYKTVNNLPIDDIAYVQNIKDMDKYKNDIHIKIENEKSASVEFPKRTPFHIAGSYIMNALIDFDEELRGMEKIYSGNKGKIIFVKPNNIFKSETLVYVDFLNPKVFEYAEIDKEKTFQRLILGPMEPALNAVGYIIPMNRITQCKTLNNNNTIQTCLF